MTLGDVGPITGKKRLACYLGWHKPRWVPFRRVLCIRRGCGKEF